MFTPIHKTVSISDFQRKSKQIFADVAELESPTVVMNRNKPISVVMSPQVYEQMIENYEDLYDAMLVKEDEKNYREEDHVSWDVVKKSLDKRRKKEKNV